MEPLYLTALGLGAVILVIQILLTMLGAVHDVPDIDVDVDAADLDVDAGDADTGASGSGEALNLLSTRALAGGAALFGAVGLALGWAGLHWILSLPIALGAGFLGALGTALLSREMMRLESSGSLRLSNAVGQPATVYLTINPGERAGRVMLELQGRTVELPAVTTGAAPIPAGAPVVVVGLQDGDTVEVIPQNQLEEIL